MTTLNKMVLFTLFAVIVVFSLFVGLTANILFSESIHKTKEVYTDHAKEIARSISGNLSDISKELTRAQKSFQELDIGSNDIHAVTNNILSTMLDYNSNIYSSWFIYEPGIFYDDAYFMREFVQKDGIITEIDNPFHIVNLIDEKVSPWYHLPITTGKVYLDTIGLYDYGPEFGQEYAATVSLPITVNGKNIGVCGVDIIYRGMFNEIEAFAETSGRILMLLKEDMTVIYSYKAKYDHQNLNDFDFKDIRSMNEAIKKGIGYSSEYMSPFSGKKSFLSLQPVMIDIGAVNHPLYLFIGTPLSVVYADSYSIIAFLATGSFMCLLLIVSIIFYSTVKVTKPIRALTVYANEITNIDYDADFSAVKYPQPPPHPDDNEKSKSETAILRRAFIKMIDKLHDNLFIMEKQVQEANEANERIRIMLDCNPLICLLRDENYKVIDCNQAALNAFGFSKKSDLCENITKVYPEYQPDGVKSADKVNELIEKLIDGNHDFRQFEWMFQTLKGEPLPVESTLVRIKWNNTVRILTYARDLREIKSKEQELMETAQRERKAELQKEAAQAATEAKSRFLAHMSHEIRTPMNAVLGMAELLLQEKLNNRQFHYAKDIKTAAMALLNIINDILDASKIQAGKLNLILVHYNLYIMIDNITSIARFLVEEKGISFKYVIQGHLPEYLYGDDIRVRQILLNLLGNAIKFTNEGYVCLTVGATDTSIYFTVSDTGIGIQEKDISRLFEAFEQVNTPENRNTGGTGLGLPITKALVEMMGGKITVESVYTKGSSFHVEIPKVLGDEELIPHDDIDKFLLSAPDASILIVDDNPMNLNVATRLLEMFQITADTALSGPQAIEMVKQQQYDIIFMDYMMPEMDGNETTGIIRKMGLDVVIIALTASASDQARENMIKAGMNDYLSKPIIKKELIQKLFKWLPKEKFIKADFDMNESNHAVNKSHEKFWEKIGRIEGLSLLTGLERVDGQRDLYEKSLKLMIREIEYCDIKLKEFLKLEDMRNFCIAAHSLKSSLANIGVMELAEKAKELEIASDRSDVDFCNSNLPDFLEMINNLRVLLKEAFSVIIQDESAAEIDIPPELPHIFGKMKKAFEEMNIVAIHDEMELLNSFNLNGPLKEKIEQITESVMIMDYNAAIEIMDQFITD